MALLAIAGCGKSEREKRAQQAADDARWEAAVAAADADRQKEEQQLVAQELSRIAANDKKRAAAASVGSATSASAAASTNPAVRASGWAVNKGNVTQKDMDAAEAAVRESIRVAALPDLKKQAIGVLRKSLPHPDQAEFRDAYFNTRQDAVCGEVDFEYWPEGKGPQRTGYRKFIVAIGSFEVGPYGREGSRYSYDGGVDIDYREWGTRYAALVAKTDCTADTRY